MGKALKRVAEGSLRKRSSICLGSTWACLPEMVEGALLSLLHLPCEILEGRELPPYLFYPH